MLGADSGGLEDAIEGMERGVILETGIIPGRPPPGRSPTNDHLFIEEEVDTEIGKDAAQAPRRVQSLVTKGIELLAIGTGVGRTKPNIRVHFLGTDRLPGGGEHHKEQNGDMEYRLQETSSVVSRVQ